MSTSRARQFSLDTGFHNCGSLTHWQFQQIQVFLSPFSTFIINYATIKCYLSYIITSVPSDLMKKGKKNFRTHQFSIRVASNQTAIYCGNILCIWKEIPIPPSSKQALRICKRIFFTGKRVKINISKLLQ